MSTYTYGRTQNTKNYPTVGGGTMEIGHAKFLFKPVYDYVEITHSGRLQEQCVNRYSKKWEDKDMPQYIVVCDKFGGNTELTIHDSHGLKSEYGNTYELGATFGDTDFGPQVGVLKKVGNKWVAHMYEFNLEEINKCYPDTVKVEVDEAYFTTNPHAFGPDSGAGWKKIKFPMTPTAIIQDKYITTLNLKLTRNDGWVNYPDYKKEQIILVK